MGSRFVRYKYTINHRLSTILPRELYPSEIRLRLYREHGILPWEFDMDRSIEFGSGKRIPLKRLVVYALIFGCSMDELYTTGKAESGDRLLSIFFTIKVWWLKRKTRMWVLNPHETFYLSGPDGTHF